MSIRRQTVNRLTLYRECGVCGRSFRTTADSPWMRQMLIDGRQLTKYFCSQTCFHASYKHKGYWDGKTAERRKAREESRDTAEKNRLYYERHRTRELERAKARYWSDPEAARENNRYQKKKRKLVQEVSA